MDRYLHFSGTGDCRASSDLAEVVSAAYFRRVEALFLRDDSQQRGTFDPDENRVRLHENRQDGDIDLLDFVAAYTIRNGGRVYVMPQDAPRRYPTSAVAAIYRYGNDGASSDA